MCAGCPFWSFEGRRQRNSGRRIDDSDARLLRFTYESTVSWRQRVSGSFQFDALYAYEMFSCRCDAHMKSMLNSYFFILTYLYNVCQNNRSLKKTILMNILFSRIITMSGWSLTIACLGNVGRTLRWRSARRPGKSSIESLGKLSYRHFRNIQSYLTSNAIEISP